jgi:hypothetical protein
MILVASTGWRTSLRATLNITPGKSRTIREPARDPTGFGRDRRVTGGILARPLNVFAYPVRSAKFEYNVTNKTVDEVSALVGAAIDDLGSAIPPPTMSLTNGDASWRQPP